MAKIKEVKAVKKRLVLLGGIVDSLKGKQADDVLVGDLDAMPIKVPVKVYPPESPASIPRDPLRPKPPEPSLKANLGLLGPTEDQKPHWTCVYLGAGEAIFEFCL